MRKIATVLFFWSVVTASPVFPQEHAPTVSQCQADEKLWSAESRQATDGTGFDLTIREYSLNELILRSKEMMACIAVDPSRGKYESAAMLISAQVEKRLIRFLEETGQADNYAAWERQQQTNKSH
jgi:hypothetical protein